MLKEKVCVRAIVGFGSSLILSSTGGLHKGVAQAPLGDSHMEVHEDLWA